MYQLHTVQAIADRGSSTPSTPASSKSPSRDGPSSSTTPKMARYDGALPMVYDLANNREAINELLTTSTEALEGTASVLAGTGLMGNDPVDEPVTPLSPFLPILVFWFVLIKANRMVPRHRHVVHDQHD
jgi:hypothetical protein